MKRKISKRCKDWAWRSKAHAPAVCLGPLPQPGRALKAPKATNTGARKPTLPVATANDAMIVFWKIVEARSSHAVQFGIIFPEPKPS